MHSSIVNCMNEKQCEGIDSYEKQEINEVCVVNNLKMAVKVALLSLEKGQTLLFA